MSQQEAIISSVMDESYQSTPKTPIQNSSDKNFLNLTNKKLALTVIYCVCFWNFGICVAIFGSTLIDLACQTSSSLSSMSFLYFLQNFMSLFGCYLSGVLINKKKIEINDILIISSLIMPICVLFMPFANSLFFLGLLMTILGFNMGCIDNIANLAIIKLHVGNVSPFIQAMHFFYGIGAFLTPVIVNNFLNRNFDFTITSSTFKCYNIEEVSFKNSFESSSLLTNKSDEIFNNFPTKRTQFSSQTKYAFWILAFIQLPAPLILFYLKKSSKYSENYTDIELQTQENDQSSQNFLLSLENIKKFFNNNPFFQLIVLMSLLVFFFEGLQAIHGGFIYSYTVEKFEIEKSKFSSIKSVNHKLIVNRHHSHHIDDAYITAAFWAFFSIGRLVSIFLATKISSINMLKIDIIGCILASFIMIFSSALSSLSMLYLATCLLGLFLSNTTPTSYSLAEIHIGMTPTLTSFVIICAASGEMIFPLIVAYFFENSGSNSFIAIEFLITISSSITFIRFLYMTKNGVEPNNDLIWSNTQISKGVDIEQTTNNMCYSKMEEYDSD